MKLGVDFGTTRIVVAAADRGNYPLVSFQAGELATEWFPPLVALRDGEQRFGWDAWNAQTEPGWTIVRSLKRYLEDAGPDTIVEAGNTRAPLAELLEGLTTALRSALAKRFGQSEPFEIMLGVPANANSNQRFLTVDAFRRAGFSVLGLLNEPSAASIEFGHRQKLSGCVLVYDLGGGTFDASLVELDALTHTVIATEGISTLGGDDFDRILAEMAVGEERLLSLDAAELFRLEDECRRHKEALHANSRKIAIDLDLVREGMGQVTIPVADFYERCRPLLDQTVATTVRLAARGDTYSLYVTGGGSELPLVARVLREEFGRKVNRSEYTRSATAIGLAIQADATAGYKLRDVFTRNFGVWREDEGGKRLYLDVIFPRGTRLPATASRTYSPMHNIGHFRYLEAAQVLDDGQPSGDITLWDEILFPFDPALHGTAQLEGIPVVHSYAVDGAVEELYSCDAAGGVKVTIRDLAANYEREYRLSRWTGKTAAIRPTAVKRARRASP